MINSQHYAMLEHGTVYLYAQYDVSAIGSWRHSIGYKYSNNKYSVVHTDDKMDLKGIYVTTNYRVIIENGWEEESDDEIDIEILGKDTTKVQFNYFTDSKGNHEYMHELGFDASEDFHEYGFYWAPDSITWYVDGKPVYRATENIPTTNAQILCNVWNVHPDVKEWAGLFKGDNLPVTAEYQWFAYKPHENFA